MVYLHYYVINIPLILIITINWIVLDYIFCNLYTYIASELPVWLSFKRYVFICNKQTSIRMKYPKQYFQSIPMNTPHCTRTWQLVNNTNDTILEHNIKYRVWLPCVWFQWATRQNSSRNEKTNTSGMAVLIAVRKSTALSNHDLETELNDSEAFQYLAVTLTQKRKPVWCIKSADSTQAAKRFPPHLRQSKFQAGLSFVLPNAAFPCNAVSHYNAKFARFLKWLTPWSRVILQKPRDAKLWTQRCITVLTTSPYEVLHTLNP
jgi:hypothetical protein